MKKFKRNIEDFTCENCGLQVKGNGYTNHCPRCLYSKHVDVNPGDRASLCGGLMVPIGIKIENGIFFIYQKCIKCGFIKRNSKVAADDMDKIISISAIPLEIDN